MNVLLRITKYPLAIRKHFKYTKINRFYNDIQFEDLPEISPTIIKKVLKTNNISYDDGYTCFITNCPNCKSTKRNVYINKTTGMFMCSNCKKNGQWSWLENRFSTGKKKKKSGEETENYMIEAERLTEQLNLIREDTKKITDILFTSILEKFQLPIISSDCCTNLDIRIDKPEQNIYFPLENVESETVGYRVLNSENKTERVVPEMNCGGLLIGKLPKSKDIGILVPNISDFLMLLSSKINGNIICLPNGVDNLSQYCLPTLERFKKLILWFDNDIKSWNAARHFAKKLGEKRCLFIRPNDKHLLPSQLEDLDKVKTILQTATPIWHKSIITFSNLRLDVLSDLQNIDKVEGVKWKRYPSLNKILKGHRRGELTVLTGPTGSGKTTFMSEYSLDLAMQGVNTLWGSFEIRNVRLARTMLQQLAGFPLDTNLQMFDDWADKFERLPLYFMTFHGQQSIKVVMEAVEHATYVHDIAHVIIDNVQFMMGMTEDAKHMDRFWKQDVLVAAFRTFATRKNCHVTLVIHPRKERDDEDLTTSSIFGGAKASQEADNVLLIQDKRLTSVRGKKYLQVAKNRYSGDLGVMPLEFDKAGLSYAPKKKILNEDKPATN